VAAAILFALRGGHSWPNALFTLALSLTGPWALTIALANSGYAERDRLPSTLAALRDAGWFAATIGLLWQESEGQSLWRQLAVAAGVLVLANLGFALSGAVFNTGLGLWLSLATVQLAVSILASGAKPRDLNLRDHVHQLESALLKEGLAAGEGNVSKAAKLMGISRQQIYNILGAQKQRA
jgi:transcriptional regulator of acetoin/glycerol metabolism